MLKDVLQKLRVSDLQNEIRKVLADFKGFKNMKKSELIAVMLENESLFKHLDKVDTTEFKKVNVPKAKGKVQKQRAEDKPIKEKLKKEPSAYVRFVKEYRMKNNLTLKQAMTEIKEKGLYKAKTPQKIKVKLDEKAMLDRLRKLKRNKIRKLLVEYDKLDKDDKGNIKILPRILKRIKDIIGKNTKVQKINRQIIEETNKKLYNRLKELDIFEDVKLPKVKDVSKGLEEPDKKEDVKEKAPVKAPKKKAPAKKLSLDEMIKKNKQFKQDIRDLEEQKKTVNKTSELADKIRSEITDIKEKSIALERLIKEAKDKKIDDEIKQKEAEEQEAEERGLLEFKINVEKFIKKPTDELNDKILDNLDYLDELPKKDQDRLNKALDRFEEGEEEPEPAPKEEKTKFLSPLNDIQNYLNDTNNENYKNFINSKDKKEKLRGLKNYIKQLKIKKINLLDSDIPYNVNNLFNENKLSEYQIFKDIKKRQKSKHFQILQEIQKVLDPQQNAMTKAYTLEDQQKDINREERIKQNLKEEGLKSLLETVRINKLYEVFCNYYTDKQYRIKPKQTKEKIQQLNRELKKKLQTYKSGLYFTGLGCSGAPPVPKALKKLYEEKLNDSTNRKFGGQLYMLVSNINQYFDNAYSKLPEPKKEGPREAKDDKMEIEDLRDKNKELLSKVYISRIGFKGKGRVRDINFLSYINIRLNESGLPPKEAKESSSYRLFQIKDLLKQLKNLKVGGGKENDKEFKIGELKVLVPVKEIKGELTDRQKKVLSSVDTYLNDTTRDSSNAEMEFHTTKKLLKMKFTPKFTQEILKLYNKFLENNDENNIQRKNERYLSRILKEKNLLSK